jgi:hypothetical protein
MVYYPGTTEIDTTVDPPAPKGRRKKARGSGRQKGTLNTTTREIREIARIHGPDAIAELARLALNSEHDAVRVMAIRELLDRGYGKSRQSIDIDLDVEGGITTVIVLPHNGREDFPVIDATVEED